MDRGKISVLLACATPGGELELALVGRGVEVAVARDLTAAASLLEARLFHAVLLASAAGAAATDLARLREHCTDVPIVVVGAPAEELAHAALCAGAAEYLAWPGSDEALERVLQAAVMHGRAATLESSSVASDSGLLGGSPKMKAVRDTLSRVASGTATALVRGETGTGKELAARAIHAQSPRKDGPFVKVNAPAVPDALLESELFGYEKGAFTGASMRKPGRVELAEGGTLFLDEIGEVSPVMQAKLLRLIQDREYERLGGTRTIRADVRFVAATHRDLEHMVETGAFREDLFYRLNVVTLWLPPLRSRRDDIALIAQHYLQLFRKANHKPALTLDDAALRVLQSERWPGNVRQLVNFIERLVVLARGDQITAAEVHDELKEQLEFLTQAAPLEEAGALQSVGGAAKASPAASPPPPPAPPDVPAPRREVEAPPVQSGDLISAVRPLKEDLRRTEYRAITKALASANGNRALAARLLGVSRRTLYTKLEEHGIE
jgi:two-component system, NtrC family, response regulator AtoC